MVQAADAAGKLAPYLELVSAFVERGMPADEFSLRYLRLYLQDGTAWTDEEFAVLEALFGDAEVFEPDPQLRPHLIVSIDENELRDGAARALGGLRRLTADTP